MAEGPRLLLIFVPLDFFAEAPGRFPRLMLMIHIGKRIEEVMRGRGHTVVWFARRLYCNRQNVYDIFRRESIDTHLLRRISRILGHDFFADCSHSLREEDETEA